LPIDAATGDGAGARAGIVMGFAATPDATIDDQVGQLSSAVELFLAA
jgi:hypothetical protein